MAIGQASQMKGIKQKFTTCCDMVQNEWLQIDNFRSMVSSDTEDIKVHKKTCVPNFMTVSR